MNKKHLFLLECIDGLLMATQYDVSVAKDLLTDLFWVIPIIWIKKQDYTVVPVQRDALVYHLSFWCEYDELLKSIAGKYLWNTICSRCK